jgi:periplasmic protein TonB
MKSVARALLLVAALVPAAVLAQFSHVPLPAVAGEPPASDAADDQAYRRDAARHVYGAYPMRIHRGKLPPMMYAVMITDTEIDAQGQVLDVTVVRPPASATEVTPWVQKLIRRASPFPAPRGVGGNVVYREIWLVDKSGKFQVDTLTEGQL